MAKIKFSIRVEKWPLHVWLDSVCLMCTFFCISFIGSVICDVFLTSCFDFILVEFTFHIFTKFSNPSNLSNSYFLQCKSEGITWSNPPCCMFVVMMTLTDIFVSTKAVFGRRFVIIYAHMSASRYSDPIGNCSTLLLFIVLFCIG